MIYFIFFVYDYSWSLVWCCWMLVGVFVIIFGRSWEGKYVVFVVNGMSFES